MSSVVRNQSMIFNDSLKFLMSCFKNSFPFIFEGFTQFLARDVQDTFPQLLDNGLRMLLQLLTSWKNALVVPGTTTLRTSVVLLSQPVPTHPPSAASSDRGSDRGSERSTMSDRSSASEREYHIHQPKKLQDAVQVFKFGKTHSKFWLFLSL